MLANGRPMKRAVKDTTPKIRLPNGRVADDEEQVRRVRRLCSALPHTTEKLSHGEPTFFVDIKDGVNSPVLDELRF
jgi:hypothetical protein